MAELLTPDALAGATRLLVLQPTPFCNIDCAYCYLPDRSDRYVMPLEVAEAAGRFVFTNGFAAPDLTVVWHAGEPLVLAPDWYRAAFRAVAAHAPSGRPLRQAVQTNGMLIDDAWCDLFLETGMQVGVSLDGPAHLHDRARRTRAGGGTHARTMRGVERLQRRGVPFYVICVVGAATLDHADEVVDFFAQAGISRLAFNVEEIEGSHRSSSLERPDAEATFTRFFARVLERTKASQAPIAVRERDGLLARLAAPNFGQSAGNAQNSPFGILSVSSRGQVSSFSPELAGQRDSRYADFTLGTLPGLTPEEALASPAFRAMWPEIEAGIAACRERCAYFQLCLGGAPANKLSETGSFAATETLYCRLSHQAVADAVLAELER